MNGGWLLLGANLGDRKRNFEQAVKGLSNLSLKIIEQSSVFESEPWGLQDQPWFWNMVLEIQTSFNPKELLAHCLQLEAKMGRVRKQKWGERLIDIDILYFDNLTLKETGLEIPHPGIPERKFTLMPLVEKWPDKIHPTLHKTQAELLFGLASTLVCKKIDVVLAHDMD